MRSEPNPSLQVLTDLIHDLDYAAAQVVRDEYGIAQGALDTITLLRKAIDAIGNRDIIQWIEDEVDRAYRKGVYDTRMDIQKALGIPNTEVNPVLTIHETVRRGIISVNEAREMLGYKDDP